MQVYIKVKVKDISEINKLYIWQASNSSLKWCLANKCGIIVSDDDIGSVIKDSSTVHSKDYWEEARRLALSECNTFDDTAVGTLITSFDHRETIFPAEVLKSILIDYLDNMSFSEFSLRVRRHRKQALANRIPKKNTVIAECIGVDGFLYPSESAAKYAAKTREFTRYIANVCEDIRASGGTFAYCDSYSLHRMLHTLERLQVCYALPAGC